MKHLNQNPATVAFAILFLVTVFSTLPFRTVAASSPVGNSQNLPQTQSLERELESARNSLASTSARLKRLQSSARDGRKKAEQVAGMINKIRSVENQIGRVEKQLRSMSKIPQLRMLKPLVTSLQKLKSQIRSVRVKADKVRKDAIDPAIKKIRDFEVEVAKVIQQIKGAESETVSALQQLKSLKNHVVENGYRRHEVASLETLARTLRAPIRPLRNALSEIDNAGADAEGKLKSYANALSAVTKLSPGLDKLQRDLAPIDKKARDLDKVLSKRISFKIPFKKKKISFTVRQVLESPGKVLDIALKPLTAIAKKALKPLTKKFKINIKAPREIAQISQQLDSLRSKALNLANSQRNLQQAAKSRVLSNYRNAMNRLMSMNTSKLSR